MNVINPKLDTAATRPCRTQVFLNFSYFQWLAHGLQFCKSIMKMNNNKGSKTRAATTSNSLILSTTKTDVVLGPGVI
jgi:hypothetical protein